MTRLNETETMHSELEDDVTKLDQMPPRLSFNRPIPRKVLEGKFLWHNHVQHCVDMPHGQNGFRYWYGMLPINYRKFERCQCGVTQLPHYKIRGLGSGKCVPVEQVLRNGQMEDET